MTRSVFIFIGGWLLSWQGLAQVSDKSFEFLNVPNNARLAALGGVNVSQADKDITFLFSNPSLTGDTLAGMASAGYTFYVDDIGMSTFAYASTFKKIGVVSFGVQHMNYGEIEGYDASGLSIGSYPSGETALVISKSHHISHFRAGVNIKTVFSNIAGFRSAALMLDLGGTFIHPTKDLQLSLVFKNLGVVLSEYSETSNSHVPFDVQAGVTFKPQHMPLRFSAAAYNLVYNNAYDNPDDDEDDLGAFSKVFQHINLGAEILIHRNAQILIGYNALKQHELKTQNTGGNGFTMGVSLKIKSLDIVLSRYSFSSGNAAYAFTLAANVNKMISKKRTI